MVEGYIERFARAQLGMSPEKEGDDDYLRDHGLHYPLDYIFPQFIRWYRSEFVALPDGVAWDDQDPQKMDDLFLLLGLTDFQMRRLRGDKDADANAPPMVDIYE
jgi:hypothetical protein